MKSLYSIVGMKHHRAMNIVANMKPGTPLTLRRDRYNEHDPNAVEVWHNGKKIAFIKAAEVPPLARNMDRRGVPEVTGCFTVGADRWAQVEVEE